MDSDVPISKPMFGAILENGPALGYYFATHIEEAERISEMSDRQAGRAIERILIKLEDEAAAADADKEKEEKGKGYKGEGQGKKKPDPPSTLSGKGGGGDGTPARPSSFKDREAELRKKHPNMFKYSS
jgi:hypothetical protein